MKRIPLLTSCLLLITLAGCDDDVEIVEKEVVVTNTEVEIVKVPTPVIVEVAQGTNIQLGARPDYLIDDMATSALKTKLESCKDGPFYRTDFSIGHRGAPMQYPEHTKESYIAAARMGAGIVECDVTFTNDKELVCRHSQCDLHTTTNILAIPELAAKCSVPFTPADPNSGTPAAAKCCTSDISLAEFLTLEGKMDGANTNATNVNDYMNGTPSWRTDLYATSGTLMTHKQSIALFKELGVKMTPELKSPQVSMPFNGMTQAQYAQKMLDEYTQMDVPANHVYPQSFNLADVEYWISTNPEFAAQSVYLDGRDSNAGFDPNNAATWQPSMAELATDGVKIIAPPIWMLLTIDNDSNIVPSQYAIDAKAAGLNIIAWSLERSGPLNEGGGYYYQSISDVIDNDGDMLTVVDVLAQEVGVMGIFSDWPATVSYYASCNKMPASI
ncbi:MAG: glycerophosphoryl diester phosphodiesterase [Pseudoalteromonas rhizosphaerae]|jgi:glycerophosphoryl diester phosphodiesterase|uniref:glycerophosphodiester phosphodiesterase n=1 Tax=Pseudoalteromonas neustonica TaxID=1840331 RepID=A0ABY3FDU6_9GAMM|nr:MULTISPECIES: glycerophosphodiester phosphodiesterase family protein [Pseudoalteromonas]MBB1294261.1 glycerophosphodiester phosphodiesterase [Pseudoalteromonas sp. SR41-4]MBB1300648.1 glycerophosphodiester phosphodiesterase [Pseudoalteromonas sp. SR44-8]MBB1396828.1 glycerophosphodiester phosphodiesterase [Pseudoalteromonas sp. SG44-8]MBB1505237.1 glycerophosphodiester phosphodiesterase [Pseudoalteromonas sp. SG41-1]TVU83500.1 glycerophosphodiester phosphodiesterase [Pseudoalteromonas neust|tara:strand:- start:1237 stop:2562 length:1326 start_codon:yes stop_codon:yes gene_type:complete